MPFGFDDALMVGSGLLGAAGGMFGGGGGGGSRSSSFNQTTTSSPYAPFQDFLMGDGTNGTRGILPSLNAAFNNSQWNPQQSDATNNWYNDLVNRGNIYDQGGFANTGAAMNQGQFDPRITAATANPVSPVSARASQGALDPTNALGNFLTGSQTNPWIDQQGKAITDSLTRNTLENVMPNIRSGAQLAGQYGGNRQGLAEGTAISRLNTDLAPVLTGMASNAFENTQNRALSTAQALNTQATGMADANANRSTQTQLANNAQEMQRAEQVVNNRGAGLDFFTGAAGQENQNYKDMMTAIGMPNDYQWQNLGRFSSILQPMLPLYQTQTTSGTGTQSGGGGGGGGFAGAVGGAASGLGLGMGLFGKSGPLSGIFGAGGAGDSNYSGFTTGGGPAGPSGRY